MTNDKCYTPLFDEFINIVELISLYLGIDKKQFNLIVEINGDQSFKTYYGLEIFDGTKWNRIKHTTDLGEITKYILDMAPIM